MREIRHKGRVAYLTEKEYEGLLKRFSRVSAVFHDNINRWVVTRPCILCTHFFGNPDVSAYRMGDRCKGCPMKVLAGGKPYGCLDVAAEKGLSLSRFVVLGMYTISWAPEVHTEALASFALLRGALRRLPKVKRRR